MARCDNCGRPAGFGRRRCALCAAGEGAARAAAVTPHVLLTVPGSVGTGDRAVHFELRVTSHGLEAETLGGQRLPFGDAPEAWSTPYSRMSRVAWEPGRAGWGVVVWRDGRVLRMLEGLDPAVAPAAEKLVARLLAARAGGPEQ